MLLKHVVVGAVKIATQKLRHCKLQLNSQDMQLWSPLGHPKAASQSKISVRPA